MIRIHLGCGGQLPGISDDQEGFVNVDVSMPRELVGHPRLSMLVGGFPRFVQADMTALPFPDDFADEIYSNHALEHVRPAEVPLVLAECLRVLKPGGKMSHCVPDLLGIAQKLVETGGDLNWSAMGERTGDFERGYSKLLTGIYGDQPADRGLDADVHRTGFTPRTAGDLAGAAGFRDVSVKQIWAMEIFSLIIEGYK